MIRKRFEYRFYRERHPFLNKIRIGIRYLVFLFIGYIAVQTFFIQTYRVDSIAMMPAYKPGDRILASPLPIGAPLPLTHRRLPGFSPLRRGDVVVLKPPYAEEETLIGEGIRWMAGFITLQNTWEAKKPTDWSRSMVIKRVVGLPGDTIRVRNLEILVKPKGTTDFVSEFSLAFSPYTIEKEGKGNYPEDLYQMESEEILLQEGEFFVASDHRALALDSRVWGAVRREQIRSKVLIVYWPFHAAGD